MKVFVPNEGYSPNPLKKLDRNMACPCRSGKKFKKCCEPMIPHFVKTEILPQWIILTTAAKAGEKAW